MGDRNQVLYVEQLRGSLRGPVLEVGGRDYGNPGSLRALFPDDDYLGVDLTAGPGVDHVLDMTRPLAELDAAFFQGRRFATILCMSVLEHCRQPFRMAANITALLEEPAGRAVLAAPFAWQLHGYPSDYWRFTPDGLAALFPDLNFEPALDRCSTDIDGDFRPLDEALTKLPFSGKAWRKNGQGAAGMILDGVRGSLGRLPGLRWLRLHRYVLPPTMIYRVGMRSPRLTNAGPRPHLG